MTIVNGIPSSNEPVQSVVPATCEVTASVEPIKTETVHQGTQEEPMKEDDAESESEEDSDEEEEEGEVPEAVAVVDATGRPLSDIEIAAQYAAIEIQSMSTQFATAVVDASKPTAAPMVPSTSNDNSTTTDTIEDEEEDDNDEEEAETANGAAVASSSGDDDSSDEESGLGEEEDPRKLRAEIEAAMEKEENKASVPLKTANEVAVLPVREPDVKELTSDCPIARCGTVLNVSRPGLIVTVKSDSGVKPLDEGSVLCFADRTVLGCVDEVFGPVLMPMYLVRFENAEKIPAQTDINTPVYYATEHTTYIIPENIRDKGTDASNIFDEETDEAVYSDDEAEAAAKRQNRKRNRGGDSANTISTENGSGGKFTDYQGGRHHSGGGRGRGRGRGGRGNSNGYGQQFHPHAPHMHIQAQPHGGITRYTTPAYGQPGMQAYPPGPGQFQPPGYGGVPPFPQGQYAPPPPATMPGYNQPSYSAPQALPPYPPQAPPPNYYNQPPPHGYAQAPPPPGNYRPSSGYYQQPHPDTYNQHPPPPPPGGSYGPQRGRHH